MKLLVAVEEIDTYYEYVDSKRMMPIYETMAKRGDVFVLLDVIEHYPLERVSYYSLLSQSGRVYIQAHYWFKDIDDPWKP